jgi:hypothetical protein
VIREALMALRFGARVEDLINLLRHSRKSTKFNPELESGAGPDSAPPFLQKKKSAVLRQRGSAAAPSYDVKSAAGGEEQCRCTR